MAKLFGNTIKYLYLLCFLILLILNSSILFAVHWSPDTGITLSGTYTRFVPRGSPVSFSANAMDRDKYTETNNNYGYDYYSFTVNSDTSDWTWDIPGLTEISQHSSFYSSTYNTSFSGRTTENTPCRDYTVSVTADDNSSIGQNDTGSRNDSAVSKQLTATVYDMILSYTPNAACTINNTTHPLVIRPINNDDDNNNLTEDNQETNVTGEDDLIPVEITVTPNNTSVNTYMKLRISGSEVRVFANADRSGEYNINSTNGTEINLSSLTGNESSKSITFYIEPQSCLWGTFTAYLYPDYTDEPNTLWHSDMMFNMGGITKTVYVANSGVNIREYNNYNDQNEMISPGMVIGKYDELNRETKSLALNTSLTNEITDYSVTICKNNNNIKLFYTTYNNNTFTPEEIEITNNTTFEKNNIPNIMVKGLEPGSTVVTAKLNIKEINGETCNLTDFHSDSMLINTVCANTGITGFNDANENTSPGYTLGLNRSNVINFSVANTDNTYTGYKAVIQVPNNIELYTDENLTDVAQREYTIGTDSLPSTLYMKGVQGTQGTVTYSFYSPSNALIHKDCLKIDVVYCDLKTDSNNDGYIDENNNTDESIEETYPGKYIPCNTDDDNMSGIEDRYDTLPDNNNSGNLMSDGELKEIKLFSPIAYNFYPMGQNPYAGFKLKLTYSDNLKLYKNTSKFEQNMNPATWEFVYTDVCIPSDTVYTVGTDTPPESLYIEGIGNGQGEINYTVYDANNNEVYNDRVVVTVEPIIDTIEYLSPGINESVGGVIPVRIKHTTRYAHSDGKLFVKETDSHVNETDHPLTEWTEISGWNNDNFIVESTTQNTQNRTTETIYRYKWNTITTPIPQMGMGYYGMDNIQSHNGEHTIRYEQTIGNLPKVNNDLTVNLNNLTISTDSDILVWKGIDESNPNSDDYPKITLTVNDNDSNDPYKVVVKIFHTGAEYSGTTDNYGNSRWQPVKIITLNNCTGNTQTITWDGSLEADVSAQNTYSHDRYYEELDALNGNTGSGFPDPLITVPAPTIAEPWTYTYDITVTQTDTETYTFPDSQTPVTWSQSDSAWLRSKNLSVLRARDENNNYVYDLEFVRYDDNGTTEETASIDPVTGEPEDYESDDKYYYYFRCYALKDTNSKPAKSGEIIMYDDEFNSISVSDLSEYCLDHESNDLKTTSYNGLSHKLELEISANNLNHSGNYIFSMLFTDDYSNSYRSHQNKNSIVLNQKKIIGSIFVHSYFESWNQNNNKPYVDTRQLSSNAYNLLKNNGFIGTKEDIVNQFNTEHKKAHAGCSGLLQNLSAYAATHTLNIVCPNCISEGIGRPSKNDIWAFYGHGSQNSICFNYLNEFNNVVYSSIFFNNNNLYAKLIDQNYINTDSYHLNINSLSHIKLAYLYACDTALFESYSFASKLCEVFNVQCSVGFACKVIADGPFKEFDRLFWEGLMQKKTIFKSFDDASTSIIYKPHEYSYLNYNVFYNKYNLVTTDRFEPSIFGEDQNQTIF